MSKFEYTVVTRALNQAGTNIFLKELNKLGEQGWEAVGMIDSSPVGFGYILMKRKKNS
ncbi:hypothetical protein LCGC14_1286280 [marine sediment metagenome]|uniref:DUF4177 domain-containing protein n=1 Tax=marine sediment metagenome TaxID=412755 RepID=A0A0F9NWP9_9ZZZZ